MDDDSREHLVRAAEVGDAMTAKVAAAKLHSMGIESQLRGDALGPYPTTVGRLALTEIWVRESDLEDALEALGAETVEEAEFDGTEPSGSTAADPVIRLLALATAGVLVVAVVVSLMRVF